jgi:hypothetical protein
MPYFRHPKTKSERTADQALLHDPEAENLAVKTRLRSGIGKTGLPTDWDDKTPAARADRSRGKPSHSPNRKAGSKRKEAAGTE